VLVNAIRIVKHRRAEVNLFSSRRHCPHTGKYSLWAYGPIPAFDGGPPNGVTAGGPYVGCVDRTTARTLARFIAMGRVAIGLTAVVAPTLVARPWIGDGSADTTSRLLARTMGGRDLALGIGSLRALTLSDQEARPWLALGGMADAVDALATAVAFASLPRRSRWGILALTAGAAVVSIRVAVALDAPPTVGSAPPEPVTTPTPG
jgi:hypothetical protein